MKAGVDLRKFRPASPEIKAMLQDKYKVAKDKKVALHVGHMVRGRDIDKVCNLNDSWHVFLAISTTTERDLEFYKELSARQNVTIIDEYVENIEELYQMADVYVFPVQSRNNCIAAPLSVLEAAACGLPVVATRFGELKALEGKSGFCFVDSVKPEVLNAAASRMAEHTDGSSRTAVLPYDWDTAVDTLRNWMDEVAR